MTNFQFEIKAMNLYARAGADVNDSFEAKTFENTKAVLTELLSTKPDLLRGYFVWSPKTPEKLTVIKNSTFRNEVLAQEELPVEEALARALFHDMKDVATAFARNEILAERERALMAEASARVRDIASVEKYFRG